MSARNLVLAAALTLAAGGTANAGFVGNLARGLDYAGFQTDAFREPISDGFVVKTLTIFPGTAVDIGLAELSVAGPVSVELYAGGRSLSVFKMNFQTALRRDLPSEELTYSLNFDNGIQQTELTGNLLVDGSLSLNALGFYDVELVYSSRQTSARTGLNNSTTESDLDVGPVSVRGNIFADLLAIATTPILGDSADTNPFIALSGRDQLANAKTWLQADGGLNPFFNADSPSNRTFTNDQPPLGTLEAIVPEPTVLAMLLVAVPFLLKKKRIPAAILRNG